MPALPGGKKVLAFDTIAPCRMGMLENELAPFGIAVQKEANFFQFLRLAEKGQLDDYLLIAACAQNGIVPIPESLKPEEPQAFVDAAQALDTLLTRKGAKEAYAGGRVILYGDGHVGEDPIDKWLAAKGDGTYRHVPMLMDLGHMMQKVGLAIVTSDLPVTCGSCRTTYSANLSSEEILCPQCGDNSYFFGTLGLEQMG